MTRWCTFNPDKPDDLHVESPSLTENARRATFTIHLHTLIFGHMKRFTNISGKSSKNTDILRHENRWE